MIKAELVSVLRSKHFWLACGLGLITTLAGLYSYLGVYPIVRGDHMFARNSYVAWIESVDYFVGLFPFFAVLPFASSFALDKNSGYLNFILQRTNREQYFRSKFIVNALMGGVAVVIPLVLTFAITWILLPHGIIPEGHESQNFIPDKAFKDLYFSMPAVYVFLMIGIAFLYGMAYASLGLAVSAIISSSYIILATPFLLFHMANFILAVLGFSAWTPSASLAPYIVSNASILSIFVPFTGIFSFSFLFWYLMSKREIIV